jgi:hypothetical protein
VLADYIGPHKIMWSTDYPHSDGFFPGAPQMIGELLEPLSPEARHQVLARGCDGVLGLFLRQIGFRRQEAIKGAGRRAADFAVVQNGLDNNRPQPCMTRPPSR